MPVQTVSDKLNETHAVFECRPAPGAKHPITRDPVQIALRRGANAPKETSRSGTRNTLVVTAKHLSALRSASLPKRRRITLQENLMADFGQDI